jgi:hypothetical protein
MSLLQSAGERKKEQRISAIRRNRADDDVGLSKKATSLTNYLKAYPDDESASEIQCAIDVSRALLRADRIKLEMTSFGLAKGAGKDPELFLTTYLDGEKDKEVDENGKAQVRQVTEKFYLARKDDQTWPVIKFTLWDDDIPVFGGNDEIATVAWTPLSGIARLKRRNKTSWQASALEEDIHDPAWDEEEPFVAFKKIILDRDSSMIRELTVDDVRAFQDFVRPGEGGWKKE